MPQLALPRPRRVALGLLAGTPAAEAEDARRLRRRTQVVQRLAERFGETLQQHRPAPERRRGRGLHLRGDRHLDDPVTRPDGTSCLLAAGQTLGAGRQPRARPGSDA